MGQRFASGNIPWTVKAATYLLCGFSSIQTRSAHHESWQLLRSDAFPVPWDTSVTSWAANNNMVELALISQNRVAGTPRSPGYPTQFYWMLLNVTPAENANDGEPPLYFCQRSMRAYLTTEISRTRIIKEIVKLWVGTQSFRSSIHVGAPFISLTHPAAPRAIHQRFPSV